MCLDESRSRTEASSGRNSHGGLKLRDAPIGMISVPDESTDRVTTVQIECLWRRAPDARSGRVGCLPSGRVGPPVDTQSRSIRAAIDEIASQTPDSARPGLVFHRRIGRGDRSRVLREVLFDSDPRWSSLSR